MQKNIIGIDPGQTGGIALISIDITYETQCIPAILSYSMEELCRLKAKQCKYQIKTVAVLPIVKLSTIKSMDKSTVVIEDVHSIFGASAKSNFGFGFNCGYVKGYLEALGHEIYYITPKEWQKIVWQESDIVMKNNKKDTKATSLNAVRRLYPDINLLPTPRSKIPHNGMVDALLIAHSFLIKNNLYA